MTKKEENNCMDVVGILDDIEGYLGVILDQFARITKSKRTFKGLPDWHRKKIEKIEGKVSDILTDDEVLQEDIEAYIFNNVK